MGVGGQHHDPAALPSGKTRYPLYRRLGGPQGPVWTNAENLAPHRDSIPGPSSPTGLSIRNVQRIFIGIKFKKKVHLVGSYYANLSRCTVHIMSNLHTFLGMLCFHPRGKTVLREGTDCLNLKMTA
jgi:hypothetical protein